MREPAAPVALGDGGRRVVLVKGLHATIRTVDGTLHTGYIQRAEPYGERHVRVVLGCSQRVEIAATMPGQPVSAVIPNFTRMLTLDVQLRGTTEARGHLVGDNLAFGELESYLLARRWGRILTSGGWAIAHLAVLALFARLLYALHTDFGSVPLRIFGTLFLLLLLYGLWLATWHVLKKVWGEVRSPYAPLAAVVQIDPSLPVVTY